MQEAGVLVSGPLTGGGDKPIIANLQKWRQEDEKFKALVDGK